MLLVDYFRLLYLGGRNPLYHPTFVNTVYPNLKIAIPARADLEDV